MAKKITIAEYVQAAKNKHEHEGEVEIDDGARISRSSDGGAYVQAWVWVDDDEV